MARKNKNESLLNGTLNQNWGYSLTLAILFVVAALIAPSLLNSPLIRPLGNFLANFCYCIACLFTVIALIKFITQSSNRSKLSTSIDHFIPSQEAFLNSRPIIKSVKSEPYLHVQPRTPAKPRAWSLELIKELEWKRFEDLGAAFYREKGIRAETTSLGADGGIDIKLYQDDSGKPTTIIQCKAWNSQVRVKEIREFLGVMTHERIPKGFYMTSGTFTHDAQKTAKKNRITLITGEMLLLMIQRLSEPSQQKLLEMATAGDYKTPTCARCGVKMIKRYPQKGGRAFWGCINYPRCEQKLNLRKFDLR
jgi:restriction system protein